MKRYSKKQMDVFRHLAERLHEMTEENDHSGAACLLADFLLNHTPGKDDATAHRAERCFEIMEIVRSEHERIGHLPPYLAELRHAYIQEVLFHLDKAIDNSEVYRMIYGAL